jgi:hypothetical protein
MARRIESWVQPAGRALLEELLSAVGNPAQYRETMTELGRTLATRVVNTLSTNARIAVVCTNEDADFLARGFVEEAQARLALAGQVTFVCFWNDRQRLRDSLDIAPIFRRYVEPLEGHFDALVVLKSIVADGCTVKTNIQEVLASVQPDRVVVAAPVVLKGSDERVRQDFSPDVASRFEFTFLAEDDARTDEGFVQPGIGGEVYRLLGLGSKDEAKRYRPQILDQRRALLQL